MASARPRGAAQLHGHERVGLLSDDRTNLPMRSRRREEFGGFTFGAAFCGWLVATGIAVLLIAVLRAAKDGAGTISIVGGALLVLVLAIAYYAGGYVAGRLSRLDGARQGLGAWLLGVVVTIVLAAAGAILGSEYDVLSTGGLIALGAILIATLVAAVSGGKVGERYHRRVDRVGL